MQEQTMNLDRKTEENTQQKKRVILKKNFSREVDQLKANMDKRKEQRAFTIYKFATGKFQNALIVARQLNFTSQKIWKEFHDEFSDQFEEQFFFRTSKAKEHTEYLLDCVLICKVFLKLRKKDDIREIIEKIEIPEIKIVNKNSLATKMDKILYNEMKEVQCRVCAALLAFIDLTKQEKMLEFTETLYSVYTEFVKNNYGQFEFATVKFDQANYFYEIKQYSKAMQMYDICLGIRKRNALNESYVDVLVNSAICLRALGQFKQAIERIKSAIEICKDQNKTTLAIDEYHLFLAKLLMENANFKQAYTHFLVAYKLRSELAITDPRRVETQLNILFFYKTLLSAVNENSEEVFNIKDRKEIEKRRVDAEQISKDMTKNMLNREEFSKYNDFNQRLAHLNLNIVPQFFELLESHQVKELQVLLEKISSCSFQKGLHQLSRTSFYQEKKTRDILVEANPILKNAKMKNSSVAT